MLNSLKNCYGHRVGWRVGGWLSCLGDIVIVDKHCVMIYIFVALVQDDRLPLGIDFNKTFVHRYASNIAQWKSRWHPHKHMWTGRLPIFSAILPLCHNWAKLQLRSSIYHFHWCIFCVLLCTGQLFSVFPRSTWTLWILWSRWIWDNLYAAGKRLTVFDRYYQLLVGWVREVLLGIVRVVNLPIDLTTKTCDFLSSTVILWCPAQFSTQLKRVWPKKLRRQPKLIR